MKKYLKWGAVAFVPFYLICCISGFKQQPDDRQRLTPQEQKVNQAIVAAAQSLVGKSALVVNGKRFNCDCTGGVLASYYSAGIDLWPLMANYRGNGVKRLYYALQDKGWMRLTSFPTPGDLIFWDNTWDKNGNGLADDLLTHVGLIISVADDGTIEYFHHHIRLGFVIEKMNLLRPDVGKEQVNGQWITVNSAIRARGLDKSVGHLASQLYKGVGEAWRVLSPANGSN